MEYIHFLNIEYLLLRVYEIVHSSALFTGGEAAVEAPASSSVNVIAILLGSVALIGMLLTIALFVLLVWLRIRLTIVEHEGFEIKEAERRYEEEKLKGEKTGAKNPRWEGVRELMMSSNESDWRLAILEADILLGDLLKEQGYRGEGIGERLRDGNPLQFHTLDLAWQAHKVRNDIAHAGSDFHLSQRDANATIDLYRRVFEEFSFI